MLLEVEEVLRFDDGERLVNLAGLEKMAESSGCSVARIVPALEREDRAWPAKGGSAKASYGVHDRKAIGQTS